MKADRVRQRLNDLALDDAAYHAAAHLDHVANDAAVRVRKKGHFVKVASKKRIANLTKAGTRELAIGAVLQADDADELWPCCENSSMIVTEEGRLKHVHLGTRRTAKWRLQTDEQEAAEAVPWSPDSKHFMEPDGKVIFPVTLSTRQSKSCHIEVRVELDTSGRSGFDVVGPRMAVQFRPGGAKQHPMLRDGDVIVAVNGRDIANVQDYHTWTTKQTSFVVTVKLAGPDSDVSSRRMQGADKVGICAVEFDIASVVALEDEEMVKVPLRRMGDVTGTLEWEWWIENCDIRPDVFRAIPTQKGVAVFEDGAKDASVTLSLPKDPNWTTEIQFDLCLAEGPCKMEDGIRGQRGDNYEIPVFTVNTTSFPSGAYGQLGQEEEDPSMWELIKAFNRHNFSELRSETYWGMIWTVVPPVLNYAAQHNFKMLIDCGLVAAAVDWHDACDVGALHFAHSGPITILYVVLGIRLLLLILEHFAKLMFRRLKIGGKATRKLRANMFSTMLQLSMKSQGNFDTGDVPKAMDTEVEIAISKVWMQNFNFVHFTWSLVARVALCASVIGKVDTMRLETCLLLALMPFLTVLVAWCRRDKGMDLHKVVFVKEENWASYVNTCSFSRLPILQYRQADLFKDTFIKVHSMYNKCAYNAGAFDFNTVWIMKYQYEIITACIIVSGGMAVQGKFMSVGSFLVVFNAIVGLGKDLLGVLNCSLEVVTGAAAVEQVSAVLNAETHRLEYLHHWQEKLPSARLSRSTGAGKRNCIVMDNVSFRYPGVASKAQGTTSQLNLELPCGEMICFPSNTLRSSLGLGIRTIFELIREGLLPSSGKICYPRRWRVIYLPVVPVIFDGTLLYNLTFGNTRHDTSKCWELCRAFGMSETVIGQDDFDVGRNGEILKFSDRIIVSFVRALLADTDVLMISSALDVLGESLAKQVLRRLRLYVAERGLPDDREIGGAIRHIKTVIYASKFEVLKQQATCVVCRPFEDEDEPLLEHGRHCQDDNNSTSEAIKAGHCCL